MKYDIPFIIWILFAMATFFVTFIRYFITKPEDDRMPSLAVEVIYALLAAGMIILSVGSGHTSDTSKIVENLVAFGFIAPLGMLFFELIKDELADCKKRKRY